MAYEILLGITQSKVEFDIALVTYKSAVQEIYSPVILMTGSEQQCYCSMEAKASFTHQSCLGMFQLFSVLLNHIVTYS